ncbi:MAG TPA: MmcQ/YjbR family DNA-binding protein [Bryobacteraceae bacterium]|nr:MmcQ/YjbR family DNA-binding protein [Bryobacteraceae bacterium]
MEMRQTRTRRAKDRVLERLRKLCLSLPETSERSSWGHPCFLAGKKTFVAFETFENRPSIAFKLDPVDIGRLLSDERFFATPYGRGQWISMRADIPLDWDLVQDLAVRSYRNVALKRMIRVLDAQGGRR